MFCKNLFVVTLFGSVLLSCKSRDFIDINAVVKSVQPYEEAELIKKFDLYQIKTITFDFKNSEHQKHLIAQSEVIKSDVPYIIGVHQNKLKIKNDKYKDHVVVSLNQGFLGASAFVAVKRNDSDNLSFLKGLVVGLEADPVNQHYPRIVLKGDKTSELFIVQGDVWVLVANSNLSKTKNNPIVHKFKNDCLSSIQCFYNNSYPEDDVRTQGITTVGQPIDVSKFNDDIAENKKVTVLYDMGLGLQSLQGYKKNPGAAGEANKIWLQSETNNLIYGLDTDQFVAVAVHRVSVPTSVPKAVRCQDQNSVFYNVDRSLLSQPVLAQESKPTAREWSSVQPVLIKF